MPSASQSDRVDGPLLRGRSPDLRVGVDDSGRGAFPWAPLRAWTVADALARTRLPLRGQCRNGRGARACATDFTDFPFQPVGGCRRVTAKRGGLYAMGAQRASLAVRWRR